jgi:hypothetical protein
MTAVPRVSMRSSVVCSTLAVLSLVGAPAAAQRVPRFEVRGLYGSGHADRRDPLIGEHMWQTFAGVRTDLRLMDSRIGVFGISGAWDRYAFTSNRLVNPRDDVPARTAPVIGEPVSRDDNAVQRLAGGLTWEIPLLPFADLNLGALTGRMRYTITRGAIDSLITDVTKQRPFVSGEMGLTLHWQGLAVGGTFERGRLLHEQPPTGAERDYGLTRFTGFVGVRLGYQ